MVDERIVKGARGWGVEGFREDYTTCMHGRKHHMGSCQWHWKDSRAFGHRHMASQSFTQPSTRPWLLVKVKSITSWFHIQLFLQYLNLLLCWKEDNGQNEVTKFQVVDFIGHFFQAIESNKPHGSVSYGK